MATNVDPEEAEAIQAFVDAEAAEPQTRPAQVELRDFAEPRRLSLARRQNVSRVVGSMLQGIGNSLRKYFGGYHRLSLMSVAEVNAGELFDDLGSPFLVVCFECGGESGWLFWDNAAAVVTVETILSGGGAEDLGPRALSAAECCVVRELLREILEPVARTLDFEVDSISVAQEPEQLTRPDDTGPGADTQRLLIHLGFEGPGNPSEIRLYLPGVGHELGNASPTTRPTPLPDHLDVVPLEMSAYLGSIDVPLSDLLKIEVGDVIPLDVETGTCLNLFVEDRPCGSAHWGQHHGNLAVRIEELQTSSEEIEQPTE